MNTVFPVEVQIFTENGEKKTSSLLQAFTRDISDGGMCLELNSFGKQTESLFLIPQARVALTINAAFSPQPIKASASVAWLRKEDVLTNSKYLIGVSYTQIDPQARKRIIRYAKRLLWVPRIIAASIFIMCAVIAALYFHGQILTRQNKLLVTQLVEEAQEKSKVSFDVYDLQKRKSSLEKEVIKAQGKIKSLESSLASLTEQSIFEKEAYEKELAENLAKQKSISQELESLQEGQRKLAMRYQEMEKSRKVSSTAATEQMRGWLKSHVNLHTGLVTSFEGDPSLENWAFTYDQALVSQAFILFGDLASAEAILSFYESRAAKQEGAFLNAYSTVDGAPIENTVHVGPNIWIGIAALQYDHRVKAGRFLALAEQVGQWAMRNQDAEGGLKGGPGLTWYSTEHNLDTYAFLKMLWQATGDDSYRTAAEKTLAWIKKYAYSAKEKRMTRGKGDSTIATDTFAWAITAIGPETLIQNNFDPEAIMEFAETNCAVTVSYVQPSGRQDKAKGFDFSKAQHLGRGGVISTEWTAQMIVAYKILSDYFKEKGDATQALLYSEKAQAYLNELQKMIITSPSKIGQGRGCLPYASADNVDTGHGWRTPKGKKTGSLAATSYGIFAWKGHNPFELGSA